MSFLAKFRKNIQAAAAQVEKAPVVKKVVKAANPAKQPVTKKSAANRSKIKRALTTRGKTLEKIAEQTGLNYQVVRYNLVALLEDGEANRTGRRPYLYTK